MQFKLLALYFHGALADGGNDYCLRLQIRGAEIEKHVQIAARKVNESGWDEAQITSDLGDLGSGLVLAIVENFDKSGRMMMHEFGPIEADAPCFVPDKMRPVSLLPDGVDAEGNALFHISFQLENGNRDYMFNVDPGMEGVDYEDSFFEDMGKSTQFALPLFAAVRDFYRVNHPKTLTR
jgi:hypothetical protein